MGLIRIMADSLFCQPTDPEPLTSPRAPNGFPLWRLVQREVTHCPTDIHFVQRLLAARIEVVRCLPKRDGPR